MLFKRKKLIITISREKLGLALVDTANKQILNRAEENWNPEETEKLKGILDDLFATVGKRKVRILLRKDLYYLANFEFDTPPDRQDVLSKAAAKFPENLDEYSWDFRIENQNAKKTQFTKPTQEEKIQVTAFAPVKEIYQKIVKPIQAAGINIEAVEPEELAKKRHVIPEIGLALKKDIKGKDAKVLNLKMDKSVAKKAKKEGLKTLSEEDSFVERVVSIENGPKKTIKFALLAALVAFVFGIGVYFLFLRDSGEADLMETLETSESTSVEVEEVATETQEETGEETSEAAAESSEENEETTETQEEVEETAPTPAETLLEEVALQILNGSGVAGEAGATQEILEAEGFEDISVGNADNFDYTKTQVQVKASVGSNVYETIERALNSEFEVGQAAETLDATADYDVILIVGERLE
ncbi:hypothetical protein GF360_03335 [candidate division WWE3 bacterium]|nr:hypothetical protein [candidate division WWE3 bacterium]